MQNYMKTLLSAFKLWTESKIKTSSVKDWNQNDKNALDYIKNRTHYEEKTEKVTHINDSSVDFSNVSTVNWGQSKVGYLYEFITLSSPLEPGKEYDVIFDDTKYTCIAFAENEYGNIIIGNGSFVSDSNEDNGLPFTIGSYSQGETSVYVISPDQGTHTVNITITDIEIEIKTLDEKFIPDTIVRTKDIAELGADWNQNDESAPNYIKNRTHYEDITKVMIIDNLTQENYNNGNKPSCNFIPGEIYNVVWNGTLFPNLVCEKNGSYNVVINQNKGYPCYIDDNGGNGLYVISDGYGWTLSIYTEKKSFKTLDEKFIPDTIARVEDISNQPSITLNQLILVDAVTGYKYTVEMRNGNLVSSITIDSIKVTTNPTKFFYDDGETFESAGMVVKAIYPDGTSAEITDYTCSEIVDGVVTITYEERGTKYTTKLLLQTIESLLIDFEYIDNGDSSFTLTEWKHTLNGEPSTELITPKVPSKYKIIV